jgi:hypothetical protein
LLSQDQCSTTGKKKEGKKILIEASTRNNKRKDRLTRGVEPGIGVSSMCELLFLLASSIQHFLQVIFLELQFSIFAMQNKTR